MQNWNDFLARAGAPFAMQPGTEPALLVPLSDFAVLDFSGTDAETFLQGQLSNDIRQVSPRAAQWSSYSTAKGRMLANFLVWQESGHYQLMLSAGLASAIDKRLNMFILRSKVSHRQRDDLVLLGLTGPAAERVMQQSGLGVPATGLAVEILSEGCVIRLPEGRFVLALAPAAAMSLWPQLCAHGAKPAPMTNWTLSDIATGTPWITQATQEAFVPQMANLELIGGVSFQKGCYPGQEIVARTQYLGKVKRRMFRALADAQAMPGDELFSVETGEQAIGKVMLAVATEAGTELLVVVQSNAWNSGVHLRSVDGPLLQRGQLPYAVES